MNYDIADMNLSETGKLKIEWADRQIDDLYFSLRNLSGPGPFPLVLKGVIKAGATPPARFRT